MKSKKKNSAITEIFFLPEPKLMWLAKLMCQNFKGQQKVQGFGFVLFISIVFIQLWLFVFIFSTKTANVILIVRFRWEAHSNV